MARSLRTRPLILFFAFWSACLAQVQSVPWQHVEPGFRPIAVTSDGKTFWACGAGEGIGTSRDGIHWEVRHKLSGGALLLGIAFPTETFGYAFGTGGTLVVTKDGGATWTARQVVDQTIIMASLADESIGLFRTSEAVYSLSGGSPQRIEMPTDVSARFRFAPFLAALSAEKMGIFLSEGPYSEGGFLTTGDGGKTWSFYDPPSTGIKSFLQVNGKYWATGHEVVGKDKPGGGGSVPLAMYSSDGVHWTHTESDIRPCHWEVCGVCTVTGCLASGSLLVDPFHGAASYATIPAGSLTAKWASIPGTICSIRYGLECVSLQAATDVLAQPSAPQPSLQTLPPLGTKSTRTGLLRCISCSLEPVFLDDRVQGRFTLHVELVVTADGTVEGVQIDNSPSPAIHDKVQAQILDWLFEPPKKDGKPVRVANKSDVNIMVMKAR